MIDLAEDFLSGDTSRVLEATWAVIGSRDPEVLRPLVALIPQIRRAVDDLPLGGAVYANSGHVDHALARLERYRRGECLCLSYPENNQYDPEREEARGHVRIVQRSDPSPNMTYVCECAQCAQAFDVATGTAHLPWCAWRIRGKRKRPAKRRYVEHRGAAG